MLPKTIATALPFVLALLVSPHTAHADEEESALSLSSALAGFSVPDHSAIGGMLGGDYEYGLTDLIWLRASAGGGVLYDRDSQGSAYAGVAEVGITYVLDVLRYVPYVDLGVGGIYMQGDDIEDPLKPLIALGIGMDLLTSRKRSYGVFARFESFLGRSAFYQVGMRTTWRWGFF